MLSLQRQSTRSASAHASKGQDYRNLHQGHNASGSPSCGQKQGHALNRDNAKVIIAGSPRSNYDYANLDILEPVVRSILIAVAAFAFTTGCTPGAGTGPMQDAVKKNLKDPYSAKFEEVIRYKDYACLKYNAKNSYGAYGGTSWALLKQSGSEWTVREMDRASCFNFELERLAEPVKAAAKDAAKAAVIAEFRKRGLIADDVEHDYQIPQGPCGDLMRDLRTYSSLTIDASGEKDKREWQAMYDLEFKKFDAITRC